jgi:hypothetical protein
MVASTALDGVRPEVGTYLAAATGPRVTVPPVARPEAVPSTARVRWMRRASWAMEVILMWLTLPSTSPELNGRGGLGGVRPSPDGLGRRGRSRLLGRTFADLVAQALCWATQRSTAAAARFCHGWNLRATWTASGAPVRAASAYPAGRGALWTGLCDKGERGRQAPAARTDRTAVDWQAQRPLHGGDRPGKARRRLLDGSSTVLTTAPGRHGPRRRPGRRRPGRPSTDREPGRWTWLQRRAGWIGRRRRGAVGGRRILPLRLPPG